MRVAERWRPVLLCGCSAGVSWALRVPWWTATSVGIAFGVQSLATVVFVIRSDGFPAWPLAMAFLRPLAACAVMAAAVVGTREGLLAFGVDRPAIVLPIEIAVGAVTYVAAALVLAREIARDFLRLLRGALKRGK